LRLSVWPAIVSTIVSEHSVNFTKKNGVSSARADLWEAKSEALWLTIRVSTRQSFHG